MKFRKHLSLILGLGLSCLLSVTFLWNWNARALPLDQCVQDKSCYETVSLDLQRLYQPEVDLFTTNRWVWIWEIYHPPVCTVYYQRPAPFGVDFNPWEATWGEYWKWEIRHYNPESKEYLLFLEAGFSTPKAYTEHYAPPKVDLGGCSAWMLLVTPAQHILYGHWVQFSLPVLRISRIRWACERWDSADYFSWEDKEGRFFRTHALETREEDLEKWCDWYLWCPTDGECTSGGRRYRMELPKGDERQEAH